MRTVLVLSLAGVVFTAAGQDAGRRNALAKAMLARETIVDRAGFAAYLDPLVERVAAAVPDAPADWNWKARVAESPGAEARLLPDGTILLPVNVLRQVRNEAELAALLAHAVAHHALVFYRVGTGMPLITVSGDMVPRLREREQKADADTVAGLRGAGYDASAWRELFLRLKLDRPVDEGRNPGGEHTPDSVLDTASFHAFRAELEAAIPKATVAKAPTLYRPARLRVQ
jgi:predicted Zn-dependent protease